jgi:hypothetical protein
LFANEANVEHGSDCRGRRPRRQMLVSKQLGRATEMRPVATLNRVTTRSARS